MKQYDLHVFSRAPGVYEQKRLIEEASKLGLSIKVMSYMNIHSQLNKDGYKLYWKDEELVLPKYCIFREPGSDLIYNDIRDTVMRSYLQNNTRVLNSKSLDRWSGLDKLTQMGKFQMARLPIFQTSYFGNWGEVFMWARKSDFPIMVKPRLSSHGVKTHKVASVKDLEKLSEEIDIREYIIQPFMRAGEDLRIIVIGDRAIGAMKRTAKEGMHITNYSAGGEVSSYDLSGEIEELALKATQVFDLEYAGVDLMKNQDGEWCVLEVNRSCQFRGFEKATAMNVASEILCHLTSK